MRPGCEMRSVTGGLGKAIIWGAYVSRPMRSLRNVALMVAVAAAVFYFAAIMPAFSYYYTAAQVGAGFAWTGSLPWPSDDTSRALAALGSSRTVHAVVWECGTVSVSGPRGVASGVDCRALESASVSLSDLTYYSRRLMASGGRPTREGIVLDTSVASRVGAKVGDRVRVDYEITGSGAAAPGTYTVAGLIRPTNETSGVLAVSGSADFPRLGVSVYLPPRVSRHTPILSHTGGDVTLAHRREALSDSRAQLEQVLSRNTRFVLIWVSLAAYGGYQLWDQLDRVRDRRKRYAILVSLGLEESVLVRALRVEQLVLGLVTAPLGCALGAWVLTVSSRLYLPPDSFAAVLIYALGVNLAVAGAAGIRFSTEVRRLPVAVLLAES